MQKHDLCAEGMLKLVQIWQGLVTILGITSQNTDISLYVIFYLYLV